jgi:isopentenyl diphosphate isomerase/L-lactate dehydrogenase-like FMN-dependent dehydrogenase
MLNNERIEVSDIRKVDVNSITNEDSRTFGDKWLSKQVIDAGIATEENLKHLREKSLDSICVRRSNRSEYLIVGSSL